jgi:lysophospholipase L1-like esterase
MTAPADNYTAASGQHIYGGRAAPGSSGSYGWASTLSDNTMAVVGTTTFASWAQANLPAGAYQGTNPFGAMVDAYNDPAFNDVTGEQIYYGGGHGDGTCNAVIRHAHATMGFAVACLPTPPAKYPPVYVGSGGQPGPVTYPSGALGNGFFRDDLTDPADVAYNTPRTRASTHMYAAACMRNGVVHYFYLTYGEFDTNLGIWRNSNSFSFGAQLIAFRPQYVNTSDPLSYMLQQGTSALYDKVTDRFYVTLVPGDSGGGWRSAIMTIRAGATAGANPVIETITESNDTTFGIILESSNLCMVGRKIFLFGHLSADRGLMNQGIVFNMDTKAMQAFTIVGDTTGSRYIPNNNQETIPSWFDGTVINRWNYTPTEVNKVYSVNPISEGGAGTLADPLRFRQTARPITGAIPSAANTTYIYSRMVYNATANAAILLPKSTQLAVAIRMSKTAPAIQTALIGDSLTDKNLNLNWSPFQWINGLAGGVLQLVANAGVSGDTVANMIARVDNAYTNASPGLAGIGALGRIFVRAGTNNARAGTSITDLAAGYTTLLNKLATYANRVVILSVPPIGPTESGYAAKNALTQDYNTWLASFAAANPNQFRFINDSGNLRASDGSQLPGFFLPDGVHNAGAATVREGIDGYAALAASLASYGYARATPDTSLAEWFGNPSFAGTGGTAGSGFAGPVVTGLTIGSYGSGFAGALSIEAASAGDPDQTPWQVVTPTQVSHTGAGEALRISAPLAGRTITTADPAAFEMMVEIDLRGFDTTYFTSMKLYVQGSAAALSDDLELKLGGGPLTQKVMLRTKMPRPNATASTSATLFFDLPCAASFAGAMGNFRFRHISIRG